MKNINKFSEGKIAVIAAIIGNFLVGIVKFIAAAISGSVSMLSEGIHSIVDCGNGALVLIGINRSKKPASYETPFGAGKELYFWTMMVALLIFLLGGGVSIFQGVKSIIDVNNGTAEQISPLINYIVIILAMIIEGGTLLVALKQFKKVKGNKKITTFIKETSDPSVYTVVFEDTAAELGLLFALLGNVLSQITGIQYFDGIASILIGLLLCCIATTLLIETKALLIGKGAPHKTIDKVRKIVESNKCINSCGRILTMYTGADNLLFAIDATFKQKYDVVDVLKAVDEIEKNIHKEIPNADQIFIEVESLYKIKNQLKEEEQWEDETTN